MVDSLLAWLTGLPAALVYLILALLAAVENVFPPVPSDVASLFGGFLAGRGSVNAWIVFLVVWFPNVAGALGVYWVGRRYGTRFFQGRIGRMILRPGQMKKLGAFYERRGSIVIFVSRFLPAFRAIVPVFAGTSDVGFWRTAIPMALASALWHGVLVYLGATAGAKWTAIRAGVEASGKWLAVAAAVLALGVGYWWWRSRKEETPARR